MKRVIIVFVCGLAVFALIAIMYFAFRERTQVLIYTYHSVSGDAAQWNDYTVSPEEFESDLQYFKERNMNPVLTEDLIAYVAEGKKLPDNPIMITLDDGYRNNYTEVFPLLKKYNVRAVISLVGELVDSSDEGNPDRIMLTWREAKEMSDSGLVELANHTWGLHHDSGRYGCGRLKDESYAEYESVLSKDIGLMQEKITEHTGHVPAVFTYPYGAVNRDSVIILKKLGIKATFTIGQGSNTILPNGRLGQLFGLLRNNRPHGVGSEAFFQFSAEGHS